MFSSSQYYILSLGSLSVDMDALIPATQSAGYSVLQYDGDSVSIDRGNASSDVDVATALGDASVLIVDSGRFELRRAEASYTFTVRPGQSGYELVIDPNEDIGVADTLASILTTLQEIGILGSEVDLEFSSFSKADLKGPAPPAGLLMDSTLYSLTVAQDWFTYSATAGLTQAGLRVEVVAEKVPNGVLDSAYEIYVISQTESLVKLMLPIDLLISLAESDSVGYVRVPYQPSVP